ncbi:hypothetical protein ZEAMMB73_Zm00001d019459 [Zea mays]|uniref:Uncharacterized protein n=1 Tax=Zea mays TaxID=4577 RepID=A0A1D6HXK5_MAIZE|nr:hypothetical protein ZEAMMB73_Zm00001d019459 [Zea mays]
MGVVSAAADAIVAVFSLTIVVAAPLLDAQSVLPHTLYPAPLLELKRWYAAEFGDYLVAQSPGFFRGLVCLELAFQWPLAVATLYGILTRRRWAATTSLMAGVGTLTSMVQANQHQSCFRCMFLMLFLLSLLFYVDFAHALDALLLVHHLGLLPGRRGSRSAVTLGEFSV